MLRISGLSGLGSGSDTVPWVGIMSSEKVEALRDEAAKEKRKVGTPKKSPELSVNGVF